MKVLFLTNLPAPYRIDFFNELGKNCELTVLYEREKASDRDEKWVGDIKRNFEEIFLKGIRTGKEGALCLEVVKWITKKYDIIIVGGYSTPTGMLSIILLKILRIPFVLNSDGGFIKQETSLKFKIKKFFIGSASWYLSTGKLTNKYLEYYGANISNSYIYPFTSIKKEDLIENLINYNEKIDLRKKVNIDSKLIGKKIVLSVGRLIECKGYKDLINIWTKVPKEYELIIVGSGEKKEELQRIIDLKQIENVTMIDFKVKSELEKYYLMSDLFILLTKEDIWGLVINEALAYGLPIITTDTCIGGVELLENDVNGYIVERDNHEDIIDKIQSLLVEEEKIRNIRLNNLEKARQYTIEEMASKTYSILKGILEDRESKNV